MHRYAWALAIAATLFGVGPASAQQAAISPLSIQFVVAATSPPGTNGDTALFGVRLTTKDLLRSAQLDNPGLKIRLVSIRDLADEEAGLFNDGAMLLADDGEAFPIFTGELLGGGIEPVQAEQRRSGRGGVSIDRTRIVPLRITIAMPGLPTGSASVLSNGTLKGSIRGTGPLLFSRRTEIVTGSGTLAPSVPVSVFAGVVTAGAERLLP